MKTAPLVFRGAVTVQAKRVASDARSVLRDQRLRRFRRPDPEAHATPHVDAVADTVAAFDTLVEPHLYRHWPEVVAHQRTDIDLRWPATDGARSIGARHAVAGAVCSGLLDEVSNRAELPLAYLIKG